MKKNYFDYNTKRKRDDKDNNKGYDSFKKFKLNSKKDKGKRELRFFNQSFGPGKPSNSSSRNGSNNDSEKTYWTCSGKGHFSGDSRCPKYAKWAKENPKKAKAKEDFLRAKKSEKSIRAVYKKAFNVMKEPSRTPFGSGKDEVKS